ncbi:MAG: phage major tail tube protein [Acetobacter sp.]|nr:phage major tail tube protein [Acetobacter sp.]
MALPRYILRDCTIFVDGDSKIGQASEITLPVPTEKYEEVRNCGMIMPIEVPMGYEKLDASFKMTAVDPQVLSLFGIGIGATTSFMVTGALVDEDGTVTQAIAYMQGRLSKTDPGTWKTGEASPLSLEMSIRYYSLEIGGVPVLSMTPFRIVTPGGAAWDAISDALMVS